MSPGKLLPAPQVGELTNIQSGKLQFAPAVLATVRRNAIQNEVSQRSPASVRWNRTTFLGMAAYYTEQAERIDGAPRGSPNAVVVNDPDSRRTGKYAASYGRNRTAVCATELHFCDMVIRKK
jgi:hypothetical protein